MKHKFLALLALFVIVACIPAAVSLVGLVFAVVRSPSFDIVARKNSPDHVLDAVHVMPRTNATMGIVHWVYITAAGDVIPDYRFLSPMQTIGSLLPKRWMAKLASRGRPTRS
jgi:hypothetical protein